MHSSSIFFLWQKIKDQVNEFDKKTRSMVGLLNKIHSTPADSRQFRIICYAHPHWLLLSYAVPTLINSVHPILDSCKDVTSNLAAIVPENQFWRWKDMWSNSMRTAVFAAALIEYLEHRKLLSFTESEDILGRQSFFLSCVEVALWHLIHVSKARMEW